MFFDYLEQNEQYLVLFCFLKRERIFKGTRGFTSVRRKRATTEERKQEPELNADGDPQRLLSAGPGSRGTAELEVGGLTQKMMLNPKIKYLMQQLTS